MSSINLETSRFKTYIKLDGEGNSPSQYSDQSKIAIIQQYQYLLSLGYNKTESSIALGKLHYLHPSTIRKWNSMSKYCLNHTVDFKTSKYPLVKECIYSSNIVQPAHVKVVKQPEHISTLDKIVNSLLKIKSISLTLKFNKD